MVARLRLRREDGATAVEYAIMLALIAGVAVIAVSYLGEQANESLECAEIGISLDGYCVGGTLVCNVKGAAAKTKKCKKADADVEWHGTSILATPSLPSLAIAT